MQPLTATGPARPSRAGLREEGNRMKTNEMRRPPVDFRLGSFTVFVSALLVLAALIPASAQAESASCIRVEVKQSVRLPHGELIAPGTLKLCRERHSPVAHRHHTTIDGRPVALLMSVTELTEAVDSLDPVVVFNASEDGHLELVGYTLAAGGKNHAHWFVKPGRKPKTEVRVSEPQIMIAATLD